MANVNEDHIDYLSIGFEEYLQMWLPLADNFLDLWVWKLLGMTHDYNEGDFHLFQASILWLILMKIK